MKSPHRTDNVYEENTVMLTTWRDRGEPRNRRSTQRVLFTLACLVAAASAWSAVAQPLISSDFVVTHVRVFDGERVHEDFQVTVRGGLILAVGRGVSASRNLRIVDGRGATLIPGLIDAHAHVVDAEDLEDALRFGVTTVLDMGAQRITLDALSSLRGVAASRLNVADFRSAGYGAPAPGGHGTEYGKDSGVVVPTVSTVEIADEYVSARRSEGSDYLKIFLNGVRAADRATPNLDLARVSALVAAAHSRGMLAVAHVENLEDIQIALDGGVDGLAHIYRRGDINSPIAKQIAARKMFVIATLDIADGFADGRATLLEDRKLLPYLSSANKEHLARPLSARTVADVIAARSHDILAARSLHEAGVMLLAGTDASPGNPAIQGVSLHRELELLTRAGLSPIEALRAATSRTADTFRLTDRGRIAVGRKADMVLVRGDPTSDITATRDILRVWRAGVELDRRPERK